MRIRTDELRARRDELVFEQFNGGNVCRRVTVDLTAHTVTYLAEKLWEWHKIHAAELAMVDRVMKGGS